MNFRLGPEDSLQASCVQWHRLQYPTDWVFAIPNGSDKSLAARVVMKKTGLRAGIWDLFLPEARGNFHGLFMEAKVKYQNGKKNYLSKEQKEFGEHVRRAGFVAEVFYTFEEYQHIIKWYKTLPLVGVRSEAS